MGRIYRVRHISIERAFAMKVLRRDLARDSDLAARFIQEARATASVKHPNVVEITDFGHLPEGTPYFVMELLAGQTLGEIIRAGGPIPAGRAVRIIRQIAGALGAAHASGIVHRDLKPDNVFLLGSAALGPSAELRVVDFGAAKIIGSSRMTRTGIVFGTPHYMSPEQASGQPVDHRADIYALGVIMYEMFTGRVPFEADTYMGVLTQHMFVQPVPPSQVCAAAKELGALEEITLICLAKKPEERFASMDDLVEAVDSSVHVQDDATAQIAPHLQSRASRAPPSVHHVMADELEPPSLEEMRIAINGRQPWKRAKHWPWFSAVGAALLLVIAVWSLLSREPPRAPGPAAGTMSAAAPIPTTVQPISLPSPSVVEAIDVESLPEAPPPIKKPGATPAPPPPRTTPSSTAVGRAGAGAIDDIGDPFVAKHQ
jgi:serine/threonine-protein kinase